MQFSMLRPLKSHNQHSNYPSVSTTDAGKTLDLKKLLAGERYAWITHNGETYLLQITKSNKLLLTK